MYTVRFQGHGALVLTADQLWFSLGKPQKDLFIQLLDVDDVRAGADLLLPVGDRGKTVRGPMLTVTFEDPAVRDSNRAHFKFRSPHGDADCAEWEELISTQVSLACGLRVEWGEGKGCQEFKVHTVYTVYPRRSAWRGLKVE